MEKTNLLDFMSSVIDELVVNERFGTAHVYRSVLNSVNEYAGGKLLMDEITPTFLKGYEDHLVVFKHREWNTSSTYLRCLQTVYNRALDLGLAPFVPRHFKGVFTGTKRNHQRALSVQDVREVLETKPDVAEPGKESSSKDFIKKARVYLELMIRLQGIPFIDLAYLRKSDLKNGYLVLRRHKTQAVLRIRVSQKAMRLIMQYGNKDVDSPYLLDILDGHLTGYEAYQDYQSKLRLMNLYLKRLAAERQIPIQISTYCARHTWATQAKFCGIPTEIISEGLGHASVTTTEAYLKAFENGVLDRANELVMKYIFEDKKSRILRV